MANVTVKPVPTASVPRPSDQPASSLVDAVVAERSVEHAARAFPKLPAAAAPPPAGGSASRRSQTTAQLAPYVDDMKSAIDLFRTLDVGERSMI